MKESNDFYNDGFGWICRHCSPPEKRRPEDNEGPSRLLSEGESEGRQPRLSTRGLAKWADPAQRALVCPQCGITELIDIR